ncbi:MAG: class F sortase [Ornithinimicrobium sp.]
MHRAGWVRGLWLVRARIAVLLASIAMVATAAVSISAAAGPADIGTIDIATTDSTGSTGSTDSMIAATATAGESRAGARPAVPDVRRVPARQSALSSRQPTPRGLRVPSVALDAPLDATGVREDGLMQIPDDGDRVGWYRYGPRPGSGIGSVVLAGHVDTSQGPGAMAALREVPLRAEVEVMMSDGTTASYEVIGRETVPKDDLASDDIFDRDGPERLILITCGGPWQTSESSYRDNVVVVATPVDRR